MLALGALFLVHAHGHNAVCMMEQKMVSTNYKLLRWQLYLEFALFY
jgi:hypothetical protein